MAIPAAQNSVVGSVAIEALGKAAGVNSMMRELGGVFGIAAAVAVFAATGGYASAQAASPTASAPAIGVSAGLALAGALAALALPSRRSSDARDSHYNHRRQRTMSKVMVRYKVKPECAEENVRAGPRGLRGARGARNRPGLRYATFQLEDGVSFVHVASTTTSANPLRR